MTATCLSMTVKSVTATIYVSDGHKMDFDIQSKIFTYTHDLWLSWIGRHSLPCGRYGHVLWPPVSSTFDLGSCFLVLASLGLLHVVLASIVCAAVR